MARMMHLQKNRIGNFVGRILFILFCISLLKTQAGWFTTEVQNSTVKSHSVVLNDDDIHAQVSVPVTTTNPDGLRLITRLTS